MEARREPWQAGSYSTQTDIAGAYGFPELPIGGYTVSASAYGYETAIAENVVIEHNSTNIVNFTLNVLTPVVVNGTVRDAFGQGWPLYARLEISAPGFGQTIHTDLLHGSYTANLYAGVEYIFQVSAVSPGYMPATVIFTPDASSTRDFALQVAPTCNAPGYDNTCIPLPGSLLVGRTFDQNTGAGLAEASIHSLTAECEFKAPLRFGDTAEIEVTVARLGGKSITFRYRIYRAATAEQPRTASAEGTVVCAVVDLARFMAIAVSERVISMIEDLVERER